MINEYLALYSQNKTQIQASHEKNSYRLRCIDNVPDNHGSELETDDEPSRRTLNQERGAGSRTQLHGVPARRVRHRQREDIPRALS